MRPRWWLIRWIKQRISLLSMLDRALSVDLNFVCTQFLDFRTMPKGMLKLDFIYIYSGFNGMSAVVCIYMAYPAHLNDVYIKIYGFLFRFSLSSMEHSSLHIISVECNCVAFHIMIWRHAIFIFFLFGEPFCRKFSFSPF